VLLPSARRCSALRSRSVVSRGDSWSLQPEPRRETLWVKLLVDFEDLRGRAWITGHDDGRLATSGNTGSLLARRESGLQPRPPAYSLHSRRFSSIPGDSRQSPAILVNPRRFSSIPGDSRQSPAILVNPRRFSSIPGRYESIPAGIAVLSGGSILIRPNCSLLAKGSVNLMTAKAWIATGFAS
jgi:hypothetical protein